MNRRAAVRWGRLYFGVQAIAGAVWWVSVFLLPVIREATLGGLDPVIVAVFDIPLFVVASAVAACGVRSAAALAAGWTVLVTIALAGYATLTTTAGWGVLLMAASAGASIIAASLIVFGRVPTEWIALGPFAFRPAARAGASKHLVVTAAQIIVFWGLFLGLIPVFLAFCEERWGFAVQFPPAIGVIGWVVFGLASALGLWSAGAMSSRGGGTPLPSAMPHRLVVAGPYRFVRNPMAIAGITQGAAVGLVLSSWSVVVYAVCGSLLWNFAIRPLEEADLEERFGEEFRRYREVVRCWCPRLTPVPISAPNQ